MTKTRRITRIAISTVFLFLAAQIALLSEPAFTLTTLALFIISSFLSPIDSLSATVVYLLLGLIGVPVFSHFTSGFGILFGISGGFFIAFPVMAYVCSLFLKKFRKSFIPRFTVFFFATLISYLFEIIWLLVTKNVNVGFGAILTGYILPFLPVDIVKCAAAPFIIEKLEGIIKKW